jgi:serralysin
MTGTSTVEMSGIWPNLDALLSGVRWDGTAATYGFPGAKEDYSNYWHLANETEGFLALSDTQQQAARSAFAAADGYINLALIEQQPVGLADIRLAMTSTPIPGSGPAYTIIPLSYDWPNLPVPITGDSIDFPGGDQGGDVWFDTTHYNDPQLGTYAYYGFFHEIGHALGLKHGHEPQDGNNLENGWDSHEFSVMTYHSYIGQPDDEILTDAQGHFPQTFMMWDIAALQHMYGADFSTNAGDTTYSFSPVTGEMKINGVSQGIPIDNIIFRTIWDGGDTDTYDFSSYGPDLQLNISLEPGHWTDVDIDTNHQAANLHGRTDPSGGPISVFDPDGIVASGQVFNALQYYDPKTKSFDDRSLIENAIGGDGNDIIGGNQASNKLEGRNGNDVLGGSGGNDTLSGGEGNDTLDGGPGNDMLDGGPDADPINVDTLTGGLGKDQFLFSTGSDVIKDFNYQEDALWLLADTTWSFNSWANTTILTYLNGTVALEGVDLGPVAKDYPWLKETSLAAMTQSIDITNAMSTTSGNVGPSTGDENLNLIGVSQDAVSPDWLMIA